MLKKSIFFVYKTSLVALLCVVFFCAVLLVFLYSTQKKQANRIYPNVYIDSVDFGSKTKKDIQTYFNDKNKTLSEVNFILNYKDIQIATFSGSILSMHHKTDDVINKAYNVGRTEPFARRIYEQIATLFNLKKYHFTTEVTYNTKPIDEFLTMLDQTYSYPAENALFRYENGRVTAFKIEKEGVIVDIEKAKKDLTSSVSKASVESNQTIIIEDTTIKPEITISTINDFGIVEKIGEGTSDYSGSIPGRVHNVQLAASKFDGVLIPQGEIFSFNQTIGDISSTTGYQQAYIIKNGRTVLGDGGGVCQVSTTLFRAALDTGLPIVKRTPHAYRVHYYENDRKPGFDATVFSPSTDFQFKNDTPAYILIQKQIFPEQNKLIFTFYGKKDGRVSEVSDATLWDVRPAPEAIRQDDPTLKKGVVKQVDWAAPGTKSKFHYKVVRNEEVLIDQDFYSNYRPWQAVFLVGTAD